MPIPLIAGGLMLGGAIAGSLFKGSKAKEAAGAQQDANLQAQQSQQQGQQSALDAQQAMFDQSMSTLQPYQQAGQGGLTGLQNMVDPTRRGQMLDDYYQSGEFSAMQGQETEQQLRNAAATGGIRGGVNQAGLSSIAPRLGQQYMQNMQNQYGQLAGFGANATGQMVNSMGNFGNNQSNLYYQGGLNRGNMQQQFGESQAQNSLAQGNIFGGLMEDIGGIGSSLLGGS